MRGLPTFSSRYWATTFGSPHQRWCWAPALDHQPAPGHRPAPAHRPTPRRTAGATTAARVSGGV